MVLFVDNLVNCMHILFAFISDKFTAIGAAYNILTCSCIPVKELNSEADAQANLAITLAGGFFKFDFAFMQLLDSLNVQMS